MKRGRGGSKIAWIAFLFFSLGTSWLFASETFRGHLKLADGRQIFAEYLPSRSLKPTLVMLNGLTYDVSSWDPLVSELVRRDFGVLRFDFQGQGKTLEDSGPVTEVIPYQEQVRDVDLVTKALGLRGKLHLLGLSYGGGIAIEFARVFPHRTQEIILMAPYLRPLSNQDGWIRINVQLAQASKELLDRGIWITRQFPVSQDQWYDYFLRILVSSLYPAAEPVILRHPWRLEATYRMAQGIRKFKAHDIAHQLQQVPVHLIEAGNDQYLPPEDLREFWKLIPESSRNTYVRFLHTEHKIPEDVPAGLADWLEKVILKQVSEGEYVFDPRKKKLESTKVKDFIPQEGARYAVKNVLRCAYFH
ncbi:MAG: alpha/beta hydrolase [Bdellovibrio sp.]